MRMRKSRTWEAHTESPEGVPAGSPDPSKRPIKCLNFSHTCYKVASSARHFTCLLPCTLRMHWPGKGSSLVPGFAAGRLKTAAPAGSKPGGVSPCKPGSVSLCGQEWQHWANPTDQISLQGCSASPSCRSGHRAGQLLRGSPGVWQQGLSRYVKLIKGWAAQRVQEEGQSFMSLLMVIDQEFRMVCCWRELENVQTGVLSRRTLGTVLSSLPLPTPVMLCRARKSYD